MKKTKALSHIAVTTVAALAAWGALMLPALSRVVQARRSGRITPVVPFGYGINIHETQFPPGEYALFQKAGFGLIRTDFHWQDIEGTPGVYDFKKYDAQLAQLDAMGVRPV